MHTQEETLKILGCDKSTLSRHVKNGSLTRHKKGRRTYYDEHEVAALIPEIEKNKKKVGIEIKEKEIIPIDDDANKIIADYGKFHNLSPIGIEALMTATKDTKELGIYHDCDKQVLFMYAFSCQMVAHFGALMLEYDGISTSDSGTQTIHPYHRAMQYHEKQMLAYSDRLGLNPLSRNKFEIKEKKEKNEFDGLIN